MTTRTLTFCAFLLAVFAAVSGFVFEYGFEYQPCLLCVVERGIFLILALVLLAAFIHNRWRRFYLFAGLLVAITGVFAAGRQVWLQAQPAANEGVCLPGLTYLVQHLTPLQLIKIIYKGTGECAIVDWSFLGLSMAAWALAIFIFIGALVTLGIWRIKRTSVNHSSAHGPHRAELANF